MVKVCVMCGNEFETYHEKKIYCSYKCKDSASNIKAKTRRKTTEEDYKKTCPICGREFVAKTTNAIFCKDKECQLEVKRRRNKKRYEDNSKKKTKIEMSPLASDNENARADDLSYGQWRGKQILKKLKEEKERTRKDGGNK